MQTTVPGRTAAHPAAPAKPSRMTIGAITRGKIVAPLRTALFAVEGLGKSTYGAGAPNPVYLTAERGTEHLDVARLPEPRTWAEVFEAIQELTIADHSFQTLVIDTIDWLEPLCWKAIAERHAKTSVADIPYGRGYEHALDEWRLFLAALERLQDTRKMNVLILAHAHIRTFRNPEGDDYDRYQLKLHEKAAGLVKEWVEDLLFGNYETFAVERAGRTKGVSSGARIIHTTRTAAFDAKNRHSLPPTLPLSWDDYAAAVQAAQPAEPAKLREEIAALTTAIADSDLTAKVEATVKKAGDDAAQLARIKDRLSAKLAQKES